jgi:Ca2+-binding EF-hand superfamily protein
MLRKALDDASDANGYVDFPAFAAAMSAFLEIDDNALLMSYFRGMKPVVHSDRVLTRIARLTDGTVRDAISFAFSCFDADGDGFVEASDFVSLVQATVTARIRRRGSAPADYDRLRTQLTALFLAERRDWGATKMSLAEFEDFVLRHEGELVAACEGSAPAASGADTAAGAAKAGSGTGAAAASPAVPALAPGGVAGRVDR